MTCTSCGTNLANGDTLCSKCGHPVAPAQSQVSNKEAPRRCVWCFQILKDDEKATCAGCAKVHPDAQRNNTSAAAETEVEATATDKSIGYLLALLVIFAVVMVLKYIVGIISAPDFWGNVALTAGAIALLLFPILFTIWLKGKIGWFAIPVALILLTVGGLSIRYISNKVQVDREVAAAAAKQQLPGNSTFGPEAEPTQAVSPSQRVGTVTEESNCQGYVNQLNQLYRQYDDLGQQSAQCTKDFTAEDCLYNTKAIHDKCGYISDQQAQSYWPNQASRPELLHCIEKGPRR